MNGVDKEFLTVMSMKGVSFSDVINNIYGANFKTGIMIGNTIESKLILNNKKSIDINIKMYKAKMGTAEESKDAEYYKNIINMNYEQILKDEVWELYEKWVNFFYTNDTPYSVIY
ncbi:MAG TPA: hypothetical protein PKH20_04320 [Exilispira sp.]|nr:hypothetical protein [Exilispira sp.]